MRVRSLPIAFATALALVASAPAAAAQSPGGQFSDVPQDHPHHESIEAVADAGVVVGYPDGTYRPENDVTRGQVATILATAAHMETGGEPPFHDVSSDHEHAHGITALAEWGVVQGYPDGTYRPERSIDRGQMATVLATAYGLEAEGDPPFDDVDSDHPHAEGIAAVAEHDIAEGYDDGTYRPSEPVSRGQTATFLHRADPQI